MQNKIIKYFLALVPLLAIVSNDAHAYLGPGAGLGAVGSILAIAVAVIIIVMGIVIYPVRKYLSRKSKIKEESQLDQG